MHMIAVKNVQPPNKKYAPYALFANNVGVTSATTKFATQFAPCDMLVAVARVCCGCISDE